MGESQRSEDAQEIARDVKAFAANLGFGAAGERFDYDDFNPALAKKTVAADKSTVGAGRKQNQRPKDGAKPGKRNRNDAKDQDARDEEEDGPVQKPGVRVESKNFRSLLGPDEPTVWYEASAQLPPLDVNKGGGGNLSKEEVQRKKAGAEAQLKKEAAFFERKMKRNYRDSNWFQEVKKNGTQVDRIAALTLLVRESVLANVSEIEPLLQFMEKRKGSREVVARAMEALGELFRMYLLPDRKLRFFEQQPVHMVGEDAEGAKHLLYWFVEDTLKRLYARYVAALEAASFDPLDFLRERSLGLAAQLLAEKPEQEARLLSMVVRKFGDRSKKVAAKVVLHLVSLLARHANMKEVVAREVERFMFLPGLTIRAVHYATAFLTQVMLSNRSDQDKRVAQKLVDIYFTLFKMILDGHIGHKVDEMKKTDIKAQGKRFNKKKFLKRQQYLKKKAKGGLIEEVDARILGNLITGVRRAIVFVDREACDALVEQHLNNLFRIVHLAPFGVGTQALMLLFQIMPERSNSGDRLYQALYRRVAAREMPDSNKLPLFISVVFKAMKEDPSVSRAAAFAKRLLQVACTAQPHAAAGIALLISEVMKTKQGLRTAISQPEENTGHQERFHDQPATSDSDNEEGGTGAPQKEDGHAEGEEEGYNIGGREPLYSRAENSCLWEVCGLANHVHPTVAQMAHSMLSAQSVQFVGDPLKDLSLISFLEKFMEKQPRSYAEGVVFRPMGGTTGSVNLARVGSQAFQSLATQDVGAENLFFHKFYNMKTVQEDRKQKKERRRKQRAQKADKIEVPDSDNDFGIEDIMTEDEEDDAGDLEAEMSDPDLEELVDSGANAPEHDYADLEDMGMSDLDSSAEEELDMAEGVSGDESDVSDDDVQLQAVEFPDDMSESSLEPGDSSARKRRKGDGDKAKGGSKKKRKKSKGMDLFAPAEEYSHILED